MPSGGAGKVRNTRAYSGMGRFPNNVDAMRKAAGVIYKNLCVPVAKGGIGISGGEFMKLVTGQRPLTDAVAARLAAKFKCSIADLTWQGPARTGPSGKAKVKVSRSRALVPYTEPSVPAARRGRPPKAPIEAPAKEPVEITIAIGGKLIGGLTMFDPRAMRRVIRDAFGGDDGE